MNTYIQPQPYPLNAFHFFVQDAVREVLQHVQAPDALTGMAFLTTMSVACQGLIDVALPSGQIRPVSLNLLAIADSGERKTALDGLVSAPIYEHDERCAAEYEDAEAGYPGELDFWKEEHKEIRREMKQLLKEGSSAAHMRIELVEHAKQMPRMPRLRRVMRQNITERSMMDAIKGDGESIALMTDEGEIIFKGGAMTQVGFRNKAWDGSRLLVVDRAVAGSIVARNPRVTVAIMSQQTVFDEYQKVRGHVARGSGHWARYLVGYPASTQGMRTLSYLDPIWTHLRAFHERLRTLLEEYARRIKEGKMERKVIEFSPEARARWIEMVNCTEELIRPWNYLHDIHDFASKAMEIVGRVAALLHHFTEQDGNISVDTLQRALHIVEWHLHEFKRIFSPRQEMTELHVDMQNLVRYLQTHYWAFGFTFAPKNVVLQKGPVFPVRRLNNALDALGYQQSIAMTKFNKTHFINLNPQYFGALPPV